MENQDHDILMALLDEFDFLFDTVDDEDYQPLPIEGVEA
jgi:hypothetical protein